MPRVKQQPDGSALCQILCHMVLLYASLLLRTALVQPTLPPCSRSRFKLRRSVVSSGSWAGSEPQPRNTQSMTAGLFLSSSRTVKRGLKGQNSRPLRQQLPQRRGHHPGFTIPIPVNPLGIVPPQKRVKLRHGSIDGFRRQVRVRRNVDGKSAALPPSISSYSRQPTRYSSMASCRGNHQSHTK